MFGLLIQLTVQRRDRKAFGSLSKALSILRADLQYLQALGKRVKNHRVEVGPMCICRFNLFKGISCQRLEKCKVEVECPRMW